MRSGVQPNHEAQPDSAEPVEARGAGQRPRPSTGSGLSDDGGGGFTQLAACLSGLMGLLFHWTPQQFWEATPQEVAVLFAALADMRGEGADGGVMPPDADTLTRLRACFPD